MTSSLKVHVRRDWHRVVDGTGYASLAATVEHLGPGSWQATWPLGTDAADEWLAALDAHLSGEDIARWGVVVEDDAGRVLTSGPAVRVSVALGSSSGLSGDAVTAWGITDTGILDRTRVTVRPATDVGTTPATITPETHYTADGPAEDVLLAAIAAHCGPAAGILRRRIDALAIPTPQGRGGNVELSGRFTITLGDVARMCDTVGGVGVLLRQGAQGVVDVVPLVPQLRPDVLLSVDVGTVSGLTATVAAAEVTDVYAGGPGGTTARLWARASAPPPPAGFAFRREAFADVRSRRDDTEIAQAAAEEITERAAETGVSLDPGSGSPWDYPADFEVGDSVTVAVSGLGLVDRVRAVVISHTDPGEPVITPRVGDLDARVQSDAISRLSRAVRALGGE